MFAPSGSKKVRVEETLTISSMFLPVEDLGHGSAIVSFVLLSSPSSPVKPMLQSPEEQRKVKHKTRKKKKKEKKRCIKDSLKLLYKKSQPTNKQSKQTKENQQNPTPNSHRKPPKHFLVLLRKSTRKKYIIWALQSTGCSSQPLCILMNWSHH